jgi:acyl carrier protein
MSEDHDAVLAQVREFLCGMLKPEEASLLEPDTSLRQLGVLNSIGMAKLVAFIRDELGVEVPMRRATSRSLQTLDDIARLIVSIRAGLPAAPAPQP